MARPLIRNLACIGLIALVLTSGTSAVRAQAGGQKTFATPEAAVKALVGAVKSRSTQSLFAVLGPEMRGSMTTGSSLLDEIQREEFLQAATTSKIRKSGQQPDHRIVYFGKLGWPFPAPLVKVGSAWRFDGAAGRQEVEDRRLGMNELFAIAACRSYVDAQLDYASKDRTGSGYLEFAQKIISSPGARDGLFWKDDGTGEPSPLGPLLADAAEAMARGETPKPLAGYYFRVLKAQGASAVGGARDYVVGGRMLGGFALVAWPARYGVSGYSTFIVNQLNVVYEKDLGTDTGAIAGAMSVFDPDPSWKRVTDYVDVDGQ